MGYYHVTFRWPVFFNLTVRARNYEVRAQASRGTLLKPRGNYICELGYTRVAINSGPEDQGPGTRGPKDRGPGDPRTRGPEDPPKYLQSLARAMLQLQPTCVNVLKNLRGCVVVQPALL